jgi:hypothetical protein
MKKIILLLLLIPLVYAVSINNPNLPNVVKETKSQGTINIYNNTNISYILLSDNPFNQVLNTTSNVIFANLTIENLYATVNVSVNRFEDRTSGILTSQTSANTLGTRNVAPRSASSYDLGSATSSYRYGYIKNITSENVCYANGSQCTASPTYNQTYHNKADYQFTNNNFNGSGNFVTSGIGTFNNILSNGLNTNESNMLLIGNINNTNFISSANGTIATIYSRPGQNESSIHLRLNTGYLGGIYSIFSTGDRNNINLSSNSIATVGITGININYSNGFNSLTSLGIVSTVKDIGLTTGSSSINVISMAGGTNIVSSTSGGINNLYVNAINVSINSLSTGIASINAQARNSVITPGSGSVLTLIRTGSASLSTINRGYINSGTNSILIASTGGSGTTNISAIASGNNAFLLNYIDTSHKRAIASGTSSVGIGYRDISSTGISSFAQGTDVGANADYAGIIGLNTSNSIPKSFVIGYNKPNLFVSSTDVIVNTTNGLWVYNASGLGTVHANEYRTSTYVSTDVNLLDKLKTGDKIVDETKGKEIDHKAFGDCYRQAVVTNYSNPIVTSTYYIENEEETYDEDGKVNGTIITKEPHYNIEYGTYLKDEIDLSCQLGTTYQAAALLAEENKEKDVIILNLQNEIKALKDCAKNSIDFKTYKECVAK